MCSAPVCRVYIAEEWTALVLSGGETSGADRVRRESLRVRDLWEESSGVPAVGPVEGIKSER